MHSAESQSRQPALTAVLSVTTVAAVVKEVQLDYTFPMGLLLYF